MMNFLKVVFFIVLAYIAIKFVFVVTAKILSLVFPLLIVAGIGYILFKLINNKCVSQSHRLFH
jgi:hypothetical protein